MEVYAAIGRRKSSVARVRVMPGSGKITVNKRDVLEYFRRETLKMVIEQPLKLTELLGKVDIVANIDGGGLSGQAGALRLGLARALLKLSGEYRPELKAAGFLTRDPREVERKKYGQPKARKNFQFSKR